MENINQSLHENTNEELEATKATLDAYITIHQEKAGKESRLQEKSGLSDDINNQIRELKRINTELERRKQSNNPKTENIRNITTEEIKNRISHLDQAISLQEEKLLKENNNILKSGLSQSIAEDLKTKKQLEQELDESNQQNNSKTKNDKGALAKRENIDNIKTKISTAIAERSNFWWIKVANSVDINSSGQDGYFLGSDCGYDYLTHDYSDPKPEILSLIKQGDLILGFKSGVKKIENVLLEAVNETSNKGQLLIRFKLICVFADKVDWDNLLHIQILNSGDFLQGNGEILRKLTNDEFIEILNTTELDPLDKDKNTKEVKKEPKNEEVPAYTDNPELEDKLGRLPVAKSIVAVVKKIWDDARSVSVEYGRSFMIHIQGPWGSGKTTFLNLIKAELKTDDWVVVNFNAWQHQHIETPWWSFLDNVFKNALKQKKSYTKWFHIKELWRRWKSGNMVLNIITIIFFILTILLCFLLIPKISGKADDLLKDLSSIVGLIGGVVITLFTFSKNLSHSLLGGSSKSADSFTSLSRDPMDQIKSHFQKLIEDTGQPVAIFIDDLDRCEPEFTVKLLEGIQTLFRDTQVLYVIAADRNWIANCFEIYYDKFKDTVTQEGTRLGYMFIQKAFQLSVRMPVLTEVKIKNYWDYLLRINEESTQEINEAELNEKFAQAQSEEDISVITNNLVADKKIPETMIRSAAVDKLNEKKFIEATEHELQRFSAYLEPNPRAIKRLANFYNVFNRTLFLEGRELDTSIKVRWLLLSQRWPVLADELEQTPEIINNSDLSKKEEIRKLFELQEVKDLIAGKNGDEKLTTQDIMACVGWEE